MIGMKLIGLASGAGPTPADGKWLVEYDPTRPGADALGRPLLAHLVCTDDPARAKRFASFSEAHALYLAESGLPYPANRPLTAYHVELEPLP